MDSERLQACEKLLSQAYLSYVRHEEGRREPFNLFTVLRSESDEVRLHSRFLAALLDHRKAPGEPRENLKHFLETVAGYWEQKHETDNAGHEILKKIIADEGKSDFKSESIRIGREHDDIDILIANSAKQSWAVAVENKIWAGDQPQQLWRYYDSLKGYKNVTMLYLSLDGHEPTENSIYSKKKCKRVPQDRLCLISYEEPLPSWLEGCRQRACDEPELRESITQYLHLVRKLTGTDRGREYMNELKDLLLKEENNLVLARDLSEAMYEARAHLVHALWKAIENAMQGIKDFPSKSDKESMVSLNAVRGYVKSSHGYSRLGLYYPVGNGDTRLYAETLRYHDRIIVGLRFISEKDDKQVKDLQEKLRSRRNVEGYLGGGHMWLWYRYIDNGWGLRNPDADHLRTLLCEDKRKKVASDVASGLKEAWDAINA